MITKELQEKINKSYEVLKMGGGDKQNLLPCATDYHL